MDHCKYCFFFSYRNSNRSSWWKENKLMQGEKGQRQQQIQVEREQGKKGLQLSGFSLDGSTLGLAHRFAHSRRGLRSLCRALLVNADFSNDFLTRKKKFRAELSSPYQIKIDYRESIEFLSYVISYIIKSILRAEIIGEWPCRESKFVKFKQGAATRPYLYHHSTKLRVEAVLILLIPRVQIFPCLEQKLPAVRRPTIG